MEKKPRASAGQQTRPGDPRQEKNARSASRKREDQGRIHPGAAAGERRQAPEVKKKREQPVASGRKGSYQPKFASENQKSGPGPVVLIVIAVLLAGAVGLLVLGASLAHRNAENTEPAATEATVPETTLPPLPQVISSATISVTGDLLPHKTIYSKGSAVYLDEQNYRFDPVFQYIKPYASAADYAVANLETTLYGPKKPYSGNPNFNTPDQIVDGAKDAGFDMLLTANNHCNDTGLDGVLRTIQVIRDKGLTALGTNLDSQEKKYQIVDLNGIRVGMLCYTYEDSQNSNIVTFNYNPLPQGKNDLVCSFPLFEKSKSREPFYTGLMAQIREMRDQGADAIVLFLHWGKEYHLEPSEDQREMAQTFCDMGVDLVIGGHPHVIEPVELLTSTMDPNHKTVCLYSLGNAFSNQMREEMKNQKSGHTEDGMLFSVTFDRYSDGTVRLGGVDVLPTWVHKHSNPEGKREYNILPLEDARRDQWASLFSLDEKEAARAAESYDRTIAIVGAGLESANTWIQQQKPHREAVPAEAAGDAA